MKKVSIILPIYNGEEYLNNLIPKIRNQHIDMEIEIIAAVSNSKDNSLIVARNLCDITYSVGNFNHAKTRHEAALKASGEYLVFITQDITPVNDYWLQNLIKPLLLNKEVVATYSRQIAYKDSSLTEKLVREFNYPSYDRVCNKNTKEKWGRKNIYYSDASSATIKAVFLNLGGYDFEIETNEDVIYALNVIESGKSILYNSNSKIYHSHDFQIREVFERYKLIGSFEKKYKDQLKEYSSLGEGKKLLFYVTAALIKKFKIKELFLLGLDMPTRYIAYRTGYKKANQKN
ncbi:glycosyltransferase family 2 protein [[Brevibacterium] frigoritolerans]|nr:glycosyltransferase family 2 protein [Peribacillus frigoritolerans]